MTTTKEDNRPAWQHYPSDWQREFVGSDVSLAAQGLWMHMLCIMWVAPERGYLLKANGKPLSESTLAHKVGVSGEQVHLLLVELEKECVFSRREGDSVPYCRRWIREKTLGEKRAEAGRKGGKAGSKGQANTKQTQAVAEDEDEDEVEVEDEDAVEDEVEDKKAVSKKKRLEIQARALVKLYGETVKAAKDGDTSRGQARTNAAHLIRDGFTYDQLARAVLNYAEDSAIRRRTPEYCKNVGNFFGRERVFEQFLEENYVQPKPRNGRGCAQGRPEGPGSDKSIVIPLDG